MQIKKLLLMMTAGLAVSAGLTSCSQDEPMNGGNTGEITVVKAPKVLAYSGNHTLEAGSRSAYMNGNMYGQDWDCVDNVYPDLTPEDLEELKALLSPGHYVENRVILPFENYWVQQVYKGQAPDEAYYGLNKREPRAEVGDQVVGSDHMNKLLAHNQSEVYDWRAEDGWTGAWYVTEYEHVNNFNDGNNTNSVYDNFCGETHEGTTLMVDMSTEGITANNQFGYHETWGTAHDYNNYIIVYFKGNWYVGFDYEAHKPDQTTDNEGEAYDIERDWCFTDWIVRITPAYHKGMTPETPWMPEDGNTSYYDPENPGTEKPGDNHEVCDECGHEHADGTSCDICDMTGGTCGTPSTGGDQPEQPEQPAQPGVDRKGQNEVEINLAYDDKDSDEQSSHLSMHIRAATDVKVFIPVPRKYYCPADDMAIVEKHEGNLMMHGGPLRTEYNINGNIVSLNIEFQEDGILIWTEGINQDVIDYCMENYGDGLTFEVWNYFNGEISKEELIYLFNKATVEFLDMIPDAYINAFTDVNGSANPDDCHVTIVESQVDEFYGCYEGEHYNGSSHNEIYESKNPSGNSGDKQ